MLSKEGHADPVHIWPLYQGVLVNGNYICLNCGENQPCEVMHSSPTYATTGIDRGTEVAESPCRDHRHGASSGCGWRNGLLYGG